MDTGRQQPPAGSFSQILAGELYALGPTGRVVDANPAPLETAVDAALPATTETGGNPLPPAALAVAPRVQAGVGGTPASDPPASVPSAQSAKLAGDAGHHPSPAAGEGLVAGSPVATARPQVLAVAEASTFADRSEPSAPAPTSNASVHSTQFQMPSPGTQPAAMIDRGPAPPVVITQTGAPFDSERWPDAFGSRVSWLARDGVQVAQMRLDPPSLGTVDIRLSIHNGEASVSFISAHAHVREAIEAAMPRLRELFGEQGLNLVDVDVSGQDSRDGEGGRPATTVAGYPHSPDSAGSDLAGQDADRSRMGSGLIDQYA